MFTLLLLTLLVVAISYFYIWAVNRKNYWKDRNVPYVESSLLLGRIYKIFLMKEVLFDNFTQVYNDPKFKNEPFVGFNIFHKPCLFVREPELIKKILVKDFNYFSNRHARSPLEFDPITALNLFQATNPLWKNLRVKLSPVFTSGKMKQMFYMVEKIGEIMNQEIRKSIKTNPIIDTRNIMAGFTIDSIALVAFGTEANCLKDNQTSEFKRVVMGLISSSYLNKLGLTAMFFLRELMTVFRFKMFSDEYNNFMEKLFTDVMNERERTGVKRNDLIDALLALKKSEALEQDSVFNDTVLLAQAAVFMFAGFETSSATLEFMTYFFVKHPKVQKRVRDELKEALRQSEGIVTYDLVTNRLPYLTNVIKETLRLYPILPFLDREVVLPQGESGYSLEPYSSLTLPKGMPVYIPFGCLQKDPQYFPDPEKFDPDRFENEKGFPEYTYLPFGTGPHNCIGERFALMQIRVAVANLLRSFKLEACDKTPDRIDLNPESVLLRSKKNVYVRCIEDELDY